jgi:hypothetical protein
MTQLYYHLDSRLCLTFILFIPDSPENLFSKYYIPDTSLGMPIILRYRDRLGDTRDIID